MSAVTNVTRIESVGRRTATLEKDTATIVTEIVATLPESFDPKARGAVAGAVHTWATGSADKADWPAVKSGPKGNQSATNYGRGHDRIAKALSAALKGEATPEPGVLRFSLSGEGGDTLTIKPGDARYEAAMAAYVALAPATDEQTAAATATKAAQVKAA